MHHDVSQFVHKPVLLREAVLGLNPGPGRRVVDATFGGGGYARALLDATAPDGVVIGFDRDGAALEAALEWAAPFGGRLRLIHGNFADMGRHLAPGTMDGVVYDLGVSSPQFDRAERGFSFQEGPLDMRMDRRQPVTAATVVNQWPEKDLADAFFKLGDERHSRRIARAISRRRESGLIDSTAELAELVARAVPGPRGKTHPATRVFQALRMLVNDEDESLRSGLAAGWSLLKPGGRLSVVSFHSGEDRVVKQFGRAKALDYEVVGEVDLPDFRRPRPPEGLCMNRKPTEPSEEELDANPRARSAKLRIIEKL